MGLLNKLLGRTEESEAQVEAERDMRPCPHLALVTRWDAVEDMGHEERATSYHCEACGENFTAAEGWMLRSSEGERIRSAHSQDVLN